MLLHLIQPTTATKWLMLCLGVVLIAACSRQPRQPEKKWQNSDLRGSPDYQAKYLQAKGKCTQQSHTAIPRPQEPTSQSTNVNVNTASGSQHVDSDSGVYAECRGISNAGVRSLCQSQVSRKREEAYEEALSAVYVGCMAGYGWVKR